MCNLNNIYDDLIIVEKIMKRRGYEHGDELNKHLLEGIQRARGLVEDEMQKRDRNAAFARKFQMSN